MPIWSWSDDLEVLFRDACRCVYCGLDGLSDIRIRRNLGVDHIVPRSKGGTDDLLNKVTACGACNTDKGAVDPREGEVLTAESRDHLIARARDEIERYRKRIDEVENYKILIAKIRQPSANPP